MARALAEGVVMKKFVQPDQSTGYRFTLYRIEGEGDYSFVEIGFIYHKIDLSDLAEPYLSAVKRSLENDETPKETDV